MLASRKSSDFFQTVGTASHQLIWCSKTGDNTDVKSSYLHNLHISYVYFGGRVY